MESANPSAESAAESVPVMDELSSEPEPEESPVMVAGSSTAVMVRLMACVVCDHRHQ